jgi:imidazolonepropionase-like amidohydrolase
MTVTVLAGWRSGTVVPDAVARHIEMSQQVRRQMVAAGVRVIPGPDGGIGPFKPHDVLPQSVLKLSKVMSVRDVLAATTSRAAEACGLGGTKGRLASGYDADVLVTGGDLEHDLSSLALPVAVFHRGHRAL